MADAEERARKRAERRLKRKENEEPAAGEGTHNAPQVHMNGVDPDISRETAEGLELKSEAALPDVVKDSGLNENWERPHTPEIEDEGFARSKYGHKPGYKSYSNALAAQGQKSNLQKKKEQYANTVLSGRHYDSDEDAEFEPEVQTSQTQNAPLPRKTSGSSVKEDEWSDLAAQRATGNVPGEREFYTDEELSQLDRQSESSGSRSRKVSDEWRSTTVNTSKVRGVNKPKSSLKKSDSWIRERPELPEEPTLKEPPWLDLVRKRRWRSTVKARFPQTERERIQFERRLDTAKKGLKFNPRGEPTGITGPEMDDELSLYLIQQRRRIESDDVIDSGFPPSSRSTISSANRSSVSSEPSFSESDVFDYDDADPRNRELAAAKGILNLSRPPIKGPKKEVHKNLAMERSRQSTMKWRFSIDPHEAPLWTQLPKPADIEALNDMEIGLEAKYWSSKKKFQTGQFDPPKVLPKPRSRSSSGLSRSHSTSEVDFGDGRPSLGSSSATEDMTPLASRSSVKDMKQKLASGEFLTSTPLPVKPVELEEGYLPRLRDLQQKLADKAEKTEDKDTKQHYISPEELVSMGDVKKNITEELFTEKDDIPTPIERPRLPRRRSDADLFDLLASRKEEADKSAIEMAQEISSVASDISDTFGEDQVEKGGSEKKEKGQERRDSPGTKSAGVEHTKKTGDRNRNEREQKKKEDVKETRRSTCPEFLVKLKDCEVLEGNNISLEIVISGDPQPTVQWFVDERLLTNKDKRHVAVCQGSVHSLSIKGIQIEDEGIYECVATNVAGTAKCDCEVLVND